jgi:hypothetical protein
MVNGMMDGGGDGLAVVGGREGRKNGRRNPDFGMERSGCSTSLDQSPTGEFPWIRTERVRNGKTGRGMTKNREGRGRKRAGWNQ